MAGELWVATLGTVEYREAYAIQERVRARRQAEEIPDTLLLVEHPPVLTLGRSSHATNLLRPDGVEVFEVERGGDVTFHGPGQLVGYPILDLRRHRQDLHWYLRTLEQALIDGLTELGIPAERNSGWTGVWTRGRKIASIGVHVKQWVTWHGFALNVTTDLGWFDRIVPCGIPGVVMTSVEKEWGARSRALKDMEQGAAAWERTSEAVIRGFETAFQMTAKEVAHTR